MPSEVAGLLGSDRATSVGIDKETSVRRSLSFSDSLDMLSEANDERLLGDPKRNLEAP
jgi:hypothetical protein